MSAAIDPRTPHFHHWLTAKRNERTMLGFAEGRIQAELVEEIRKGFARFQPDYARLGLGSAAEAEGRN